ATSILNDGAITVTAQTGGVALAGGAGEDGYAQIGHGGADAYASGTLTGVDGFQLSGNIDVTAAGAIKLIGGTGAKSYAQIGHGGAFLGNDTAIASTEQTPTPPFPTLSANSVTLSGSLTVSSTGGGLSLTEGTGNDAYAQIAHGGADSFGGAIITTQTVLSGNVLVTASGALSV